MDELIGLSRTQAQLVDVYWPYVAWFIIGLMCGTALENRARRIYFKKKDEIDDSEKEPHPFEYIDEDC